MSPAVTVYYEVLSCQSASENTSEDNRGVIPYSIFDIPYSIPYLSWETQIDEPPFVVTLIVLFNCVVVATASNGEDAAIPLDKGEVGPRSLHGGEGRRVVRGHVVLLARGGRILGTPRSANEYIGEAITLQNDGARTIPTLDHGCHFFTLPFHVSVAAVHRGQIGGSIIPSNHK